jgi:DNA-binding response OmpR family regulator
MARLLVVDGDRELAAILSFTLERAGFEVSSAHEMRAALHFLAEEAPALVLLDAALGGADGMELLHELRLRNRWIGIILLGRDDEDARIVSLESGADDYVSKPFRPRELVARVRSVLRRQSGEPATPTAAVPVLRVGPLVLDTAKHTAALGAIPLPLTATEFRLLQCLMTHAGVVVSGASLLRQVWGYNDPHGGELVRAAIYRLRRKLASAQIDGDLVVTVPGAGFLLQAASVLEPVAAAG